LPITSQQAKELAAECGFELAGITSASPIEDFSRFEAWRESGLAGEMKYLTDHRGELRADPRNLLPEAQTIICVGKLYNTPRQASGESASGKISRYAWGEADYHYVLRRNLNQLAARLEDAHGEPFAWRACVDTAPLLERSYAHAAGLGWIGKNTCIINQQIGSWFFLGELLLSVPLTPDSPAPFRCGSCSRCIDACPTAAIIPAPDGGWSIDSNLCISYLTIEKRGVIDEELAAAMGDHLFGCDICQDVCPWNRRAPFSEDEQFAERVVNLNLFELASLTSDEFRTLFQHSPVWRAKYEGFLRNVAIALGNTGHETLKNPLKKLANHSNPVIAAAAIQALSRINEKSRVNYRPSDTNADSSAVLGLEA
jgi:epoxyqueuosine reductase